MKQIISETVNLKIISETDTAGSFSISGLYPGYGITLANSLRRVLLSSLPGAAVTDIKIKGIDHEFSTLAGIVEDVIEITLNLKKIRLHLFSDEPQTLTLKVKGVKTVTAADIKTNANVVIINPDALIATLTTKSASLDMELTVAKGLGYAPADSRQDEKLSIGTIALDSFFSPVLKVNYTIDNIRIGDRTDYNKINLNIETDGTLKPSAALIQAASILNDHFLKITSALTENESSAKDLISAGSGNNVPDNQS